MLLEPPSSVIAVKAGIQYFPSSHLPNRNTVAGTQQPGLLLPQQ